MVSNARILDRTSSIVFYIVSFETTKRKKPLNRPTTFTATSSPTPCLRLLLYEGATRR